MNGRSLSRGRQIVVKTVESFAFFDPSPNNEEDNSKLLGYGKPSVGLVLGGFLEAASVIGADAINDGDTQKIFLSRTRQATIGC